MRLNAKFSADIGNSVQVKWVESNKSYITILTMSFRQDQDQMTKRFGRELASAVFASVLKSDQQNIPTEELENDITWAVSKFVPKMTFDPHEVVLADLGGWAVTPEFKSIVAKKARPEVTVNIALPIHCQKNKLGKLAGLAGQHIQFEFSTQIQTPATEPTVVKMPDKHGKDRESVVTVN